MTKIPLYLKLKPLSGPTKFTNNQKVIQQSSLKENAIDIVSGKDADNNFKVASSYSFDKVFNEECTTSTLYNLILHNSIQDLIFKQADYSFHPRPIQQRKIVLIIWQKQWK